jgi:membrane protease YdiL (CAAX protease family)
MTAIAVRRLGGIVMRTVLVGGGAEVVGMRWGATEARVAGGVAIGLVFGFGLLVVALAMGWRPLLGRRSSIAIGAAGGAVLVVLALVTRSGQLPWLAPPAAFIPWVAVTILVASAEELVLRGALFDELDGSVGTVAAVLVTSVVFALMHVPLYGWHVVPLDLGVGLWLAGLRLATGGIAAPAIAHAVADLATWWL